MSVPRRHILSQGPVLRVLLRTVLSSAFGRKALEDKAKDGPGGSKTAVPGPALTEIVGPRDPALVRDFVRAMGGDPSAYGATLPAHLFPQWGLPLLSRALSGIPYDLVGVLNAGCRIEARAPLPAGEPLHLEAFLEGIDDDGRRALLRQRLVTGTPSAPEAVVARVFAVVRLSGAGGEKRERKEPARVPPGAREIARLRPTPGTALDFAFLTGDFNPLHWVRPYARLAGFPGCILHGFATLAMAIESLNRARFSGNPHRLSAIEVRFTRPLVLPASVGVFVTDSGGIAVGDAPGGPAYLAGDYETREETGR